MPKKDKAAKKAKQANEKVLVTAFPDMSEAVAIQHLEVRHTTQLKGLVFKAEPDRVAKGLGRRLRGGKHPWNIYHARLHRDSAAEFNHTHEEPE